MNTATRTRPTDAEFRADLDARQSRVDECVAGILNRAPKPLTPLDAKYRSGRDLCFAMVEHRPDESEYLHVSLDGNWRSAVSLDRKRIEIWRDETCPRFMVVKIPGWYANRRNIPIQPTLPALVDLVQWSDDQREAWARVRVQRIRINDGLARLRNPKSRRALPYRTTMGREEFA